MKPQVEIYDTTLRDGAQGEGINFSASDKLRIADRLDTFGVHFIEGGWPGSNPKDMEFFKLAARRKWKNAKIAAFSMTRRKGMAVEKDELMRLILEAKTPVVTIVGKTWLLHVTEVLRAKPDENLAMIGDTIRYLKDHGKTVIYDAEHSFDGFADEPEYALATWQAAEKAGSDCIVLCDTNGGRLPKEIATVTALAKSKLNCAVGIHTHNDCGFGVANAIAAVEAGATQVQGTINGYGERTGNCNLISVIPTLELKMKLRCVPQKSLPKLKELSEFVNEVANVRHDVRAPWVGQTAFAHKGGMHVHAIDRVSHSYEHVNPEAVGNFRRVLVSDMSGRTNILMKAKELGFKLAPDAPETREITAKVKELEGKGYEYEAAEASLALLIRGILDHNPELLFTVETYHVSMRRDQKESICEATVRVRVGDKTAHTVAEGDGPVNALDGALRRALVSFFPKLKTVELTDYKVRIIDGGTGTAAKTRVLINSTDGKREWGTVGVSENIIEASLHALVDSLEYALLRK
ncbi:MAG TPA: citramalate synthase [Verrucomicrobiota bacterium]|nr:citramalate synthase [Verrucomicrobiota bacterium]